MIAAAFAGAGVIAIVIAGLLAILALTLILMGWDWIKIAHALLTQG